MEKLFLLLVIIIFSACARNEQKKELAQSDWKGLEASAILSHSYFKSLPHKIIKNKSGIETWIFRDQTRFQTDAYCSSLGGCAGMPTYNCNNVFSVQNNIILDFEQNGSCPGTKTIKAPR